MPIASYTITSTVQADGGLSYVIDMVDQDGNSYRKAGLTTPGFTEQSVAAARIADMDEWLAAREAAQLLED